MIKRSAARFGGDAARTQWKEFNELNYWKDRQRVEGELSNDHYKYFYTAHFGLDDGFYQGKTIADIGCGPAEVLNGHQWLNGASESIRWPTNISGSEQIGIKWNTFARLRRAFR